MKNKKKIIINVVVLLVIIALVLFMSFRQTSLSEIFKNLTNIDKKYLLYSFLAIFIYIIFWPLSLHILIKKEKKDIGLVNSYLIGTSEFFFNNITPSSSGGQPFQLIFMNKFGIKYSKATSVLLINFILYQCIINIFSLFGFIFYFHQIKETIGYLLWLIILGFILNLFVLLILILLGTSKVITNLIRKFILFLAKFKLFKKLNNKIDAYDLYTLELREAFKEMFSLKLKIFFTIVLKVLSLIAFYSIPFFILKGLDNTLSFSNFMYVVIMTCFSLTLVAWIPTPGAAGASEYAFQALFQGIVMSPNLVITLMITWKLFTFYFMILVGGINSLILYIKSKKIKAVDSSKNKINNETALEVIDENRDIH